MGAQGSALAALGGNFVCAHAGDAIRRMANTSFFISFSRRKCADLASIQPERSKEVHKPYRSGREAAQLARLRNI
jgi:hypothetical protein